MERQREGVWGRRKQQHISTPSVFEPGLFRPCRGCDGSNKKQHLSPPFRHATAFVRTRTGLAIRASGGGGERGGALVCILQVSFEVASIEQLAAASSPSPLTERMYLLGGVRVRG